jgi:hypothetical protein
MILLLVIATWIIVLSLVGGLCAAARVGDVGLLTRASDPAGSRQAEPRAWVPAGRGEISARANARTVGLTAEADASLLRSGGVAA